MAYTNIDLLRNYLEVSFPTRSRHLDQLLVFSGDDYITFFNGGISGGCLVKSIQSNDLVQQTITLQSGDNTFSALPVVRGTAVVASDVSQTTVYVENLDYVIDYEAGLLASKSGGSLSIGQQVTVWHQPFVLYEEGSDYTLDTERGRIKRLLAGDMASGETVYLDYTPTNNSFNDDILTQAAVEADGLIEAEVDPDRQFGASSLLQAAATYRAMEIVCYTAASRVLVNSPRDERTAAVWMKLAEKFSARSVDLVMAFRPPVDGPSLPVNS